VLILLFDCGESAGVAVKVDGSTAWGAARSTTGGHSHLFTVIVEQAELWNIVASVSKTDLLDCLTQPVARGCDSLLLLEAEEIVSALGSFREVVRELGLVCIFELHHNWSTAGRHHGTGFDMYVG